eukprot:120591-Chlamydomonas_euryale.AAC.1
MQAARAAACRVRHRAAHAAERALWHRASAGEPLADLFFTVCTRRQRALLLAACSVVLYTPQNEHFGIVPLEAMAAGRPVVACASGGPLESVLHGETGMLCQPDAGECIVQTLVCAQQKR